MTPEQIAELKRLQADANAAVERIVETAKRITEHTPPEVVEKLIADLKDAADDFNKRRKP